MDANITVVRDFSVWLQVWAGWVYREGDGADDRADQINYSDAKCQPGNAFVYLFPDPNLCTIDDCQK